MSAVYLDSSAIVRLAVRESESSVLMRFLRRRRPLVSSALARTEVLRALMVEGEQGVARGRAVLARLDLIRITDRVLNAAGLLAPAELRSLDAIHLATAMQLETELGQLVTYDDRMAFAARQLKMKVVSPT